MVDTKVTTASPSEKIPETTPLDPNTAFNKWLTDNNYEVSVDALSDKNPFLEGKGFVLTDKPLLVITVKKKEDK